MRRSSRPTSVVIALGLLLLISCTPVGDDRVAAALDELAALDWTLDYDRGVEAAERWLSEVPASPEIRAWYAHHLVSVQRVRSALEQLDVLLRDHPESAWMDWATATVFSSPRFARYAQATEASHRAVMAQPENLTFARTHAAVVTPFEPTEALAFLDALAPHLQDTRELLVARAVAQNTARSRGRDLGTAVGSEGTGPTYDDVWATFALAREKHPGDPGTLFAEARARFGAREYELAQELTQAALDLAPTSLSMRIMSWHSFERGAELVSEERHRATISLIDAYLEDEPSAAAHGAAWSALDIMVIRNPETPLLLTARRNLGDRILERFPDHVAAEEVRGRRVIERARAVGELRSSARAHLGDPAELTANRRRIEELSDLVLPELESLARETGLEQIRWRSSAASMLIGEWYARGIQPDRETLLAILDAFPPGHEGGLSVHFEAPLLLAQHPSLLDRARTLAKAGFPTFSMYLEEGDELMTGYYLGSLYAALGWIEFKAGRVDAAEHLLVKAIELGPDQERSNGVAGRFYEARYRDAVGDAPLDLTVLESDTDALDDATRFYELAEQHYATATTTGNFLYEGAFEPDLASLYAAGRGSMDGYGDYLSEIESRLVRLAARRVLEDRLDPPVMLPPFALTDLDGVPVVSEDLAGSIVVINFWGEWCPPCVEENPDLQRFHEKYRADPDVVFLTMNSDARSSDVRDYLDRNGFDFRVLMHEGYATEVGLPGWPTTWFIDRDGFIQFAQIGMTTGDLVDEFSVRVEALRGP